MHGYGWFMAMRQGDQKPKVTKELLLRVLNYAKPYWWHIAGMLVTILVIYLQASVDTLLSGVRRRGVPAEAGIPEDYLRALSDSYTRYFYNYDESGLLIVNSERLNFVDVPEHFDLLVERIGAIRGGREFFNRA